MGCSVPRILYRAVDDHNTPDEEEFGASSTSSPITPKLMAPDKDRGVAEFISYWFGVVWRKIVTVLI